MFDPNPPGQPDARIDARVGIVSHSDAFENVTLTNSLNRLFTHVGAPMNPAADLSVYVRDFDLVFLEANYGTRGGGLAFEPSFFAEHPQVEFCLYFGSGVDPAALTPWPKNVLGSVVKPLSIDALKTIGNRYALQRLSGRGDLGPDVLSPEEFGASESQGGEHGREGHVRAEGEGPRERVESEASGTPKVELKPPRLRPRPHGL